MSDERATPPGDNPSLPRLVVTLAFAGLISGLAIVGSYLITLPRIEANQAAALRRAVFQVLPGSRKLERFVWQGGRLVEQEEEKAGEEAVYAGYDSAGAFVGYAVPAEGSGFQDTIKLIFGFKPKAGEIVGMQILESRETPGLGDKIGKDPDFARNFDDLAVEPAVKLVKGGRHAGNEVDAITGATISSTAVVKIVNGAGGTWFGRLAGPPAAAGADSAAARAETPDHRPAETAAHTGGER